MLTTTVSGADFAGPSPAPPPVSAGPEPDRDAPGSAAPGPVTPTEAAPAEPTVTTDAAPVDGAGVPFDPNRHLPKQHPITKRWMPRRLPKGATAPGSTSSIVTEDEPTDAAGAEPTSSTGTTPGDVYRTMAELHCRAFYGVSAGLISDEWIATREEHGANVETLAAYYRAKGIQPDSPGIALTLHFLGFAGKRLAMPKTQTRLGAVKAWIGGLWLKWQGKRRSRAIEAATQAG